MYQELRNSLKINNQYNQEIKATGRYIINLYKFGSEQYHS